MKKILLLLLLPCAHIFAQNWEYMSTTNKKIPLSWSATQQTASLVLDIDNDGADEWIIAQRTGTPSLIYMKYERSVGWREFTMDKEKLTIEAGGTFTDIDGDGDKDVVFGGDWQSPKVWWWENPFPYYNPNVAWKRHEIKSEGKNQHHDQVFGDFMNIGKPQLAYWNQGTKTLFVAKIPSNPTTSKWESEAIFVSTDETKNKYVEGCYSADVDGDGVPDLIAGNHWFKYTEGKFKATRFGEDGGRVVAAKFRTGKKMQIVVSPGDGKGRLMLYECTGSAEESANWKGKDLIGRELIHGHSLEVKDIDRDGNLDIFCAEMAKWDEKKTKPDNAKAEAFILYGDNLCNFRKTTFKKGFGFHEARVADIDGDGDYDVLSKPYNWEAPRLDVWFQNGIGAKRPKIGETIAPIMGLELYSLRDYFKKDIPTTLDYVKSLGIKDVELAGTYGMAPAEFKKNCNDRGITPVSALIDFAMFEDSLASVIKWVNTMGIKHVGPAWIPHTSNKFSKENADRAIKVFNKAGAEFAKLGITFFYHCHGYEFKPGEDGTLMDYIIKNTDANNVKYELDVYWSFHGGQDPALMLYKYKGRITAIHVKDMIYGQHTGELSGGTPLTSDVALGTGQLDFKEILTAAIATGVKYYFLEDENADVKEHLPISIKYVKGLK
ncbi:MAG: FG-GAP-like repeat-containing protein [Leadbetterella sp.]